MWIVRNISNTNVYLNDVKLLFRPEEEIDVDLVVEISKSGGSSDLLRMIREGKLETVPNDSEEIERPSTLSMPEDNIILKIEDAFRKIIKEELYNILGDKVAINAEDIEKVDKIGETSIDFDNIQAQLHMDREDELSSSDIKSDMQVIESNKTNELAKLLKNQIRRG
jgi:hypothetical protein